jgi:hypothetical protein
MIYLLKNVINFNSLSTDTQSVRLGFEIPLVFGTRYDQVLSVADTVITVFRRPFLFLRPAS